jgi:hypothetical protein
MWNVIRGLFGALLFMLICVPVDTAEYGVGTRAKLDAALNAAANPSQALLANVGNISELSAPVAYPCVIYAHVFDDPTDDRCP